MAPAPLPPTGIEFARNVLVEMEGLCRESIASIHDIDGVPVIALFAKAIAHPEYGAVASSFIAQYLARCLTADTPDYRTWKPPL